MKINFLIAICLHLSIFGKGQSSDTIITINNVQIVNEEFASEIDNFIKSNRTCLSYKKNIKVFIGYYNVYEVEEVFITLSLHNLDYETPLLKGQYFSSCVNGETVFISKEFIESTNWLRVSERVDTITFELGGSMMVDESNNDSNMVGIYARPWAAGNRYELKDGEIILVQKSKCELKKNLKAIEEIKKQVEMEEKE